MGSRSEQGGREGGRGGKRGVAGRRADAVRLTGKALNAERRVRRVAASNLGVSACAMRYIGPDIRYRGLRARLFGGRAMDDELTREWERNPRLTFPALICIIVSMAYIARAGAGRHGCLRARG